MSGPETQAPPARPLRDVLFAALLVLGIVAQLAVKPWSSPITWDGFGYYLYLPLSFVHHDLGMTDPSIVEGIFDEYHPSGTFYQAHRAPTGNMVIRYTPGLALINLPGFLIAHAVAAPLGYKADGLSPPYQLAAVITALLVLGLGLWAMIRMLRRFFAPWVAYLTAALILYGTNLMDQAVEQLVMTHLYSFALLALFLLATIRLHERPCSRRAIFAGFILGLLILIRPPNALAVLIPLLWPMQDMDLRAKWKWLWRDHRKALVAFALSAVPPVLLLLGYWKAYAGSWFYDSYQNPGEGLDIWYPHLHKFLFSFRKGWFIYTPLMLVALLGLIAGLQGSLKRLRRPLLLFLGIHLYVVSSWTLWYYPGGFGQRAAVDVYAIMAIGLAAAITWAMQGSRLRQALFLGGTALLVLLLQFQILQQRRGVWPPNRMTAAYYRSSFFDVRPDPAKQHLLGFDRPTVSMDQVPEGLVLDPGVRWAQPMEDVQDRAPDGSVAFKLDADNPFSPGFHVPFRELTDNDHVWLEITGQVWVQDTATTQGSIATLMDHGGNYGYRTLDLEHLKGINPGTWHEFHVLYLTPEPRRTRDPFVAYAWHRGGPAFWMKDLEIRRYVDGR